MTAQEIVACVERLNDAASKARIYAASRFEFFQLPDRAYQCARDAAHEAHRLLRLAEGREA